MTFEDIQKVNKGLKTIPIKGKEYIEVNQRVTAFRRLHPEGSISTTVQDFVNGVILVRAEIRDGEGKLLASGLALEEKTSSAINKTSYVENCETSAVGRALGFLGIGIDTAIASYDEVSHAIEQQEAPLICEDCGRDIQPYGNMSAMNLANYTMKKYGRCLCSDCATKASENKEETI